MRSCRSLTVSKRTFDPSLTARARHGLEHGAAVQVHAVHLVPEPFSVDNGLLTPSFKLKRPQAKAAFQRELDAMYLRLDGLRS